MSILDIFRPKPKLNKYGWKPDLPDHRDVMYSAPALGDVKLPSFVDLRGGMPAVYNQGELGSCTANAIGAAIQFNQLKQNKAWDFMPSRLFIYYNERVLEGTVNQDNGATIRSGIKTVNSQGVCKEAFCPYIISRFTKKPSAAAYQEALFHKALTYQRLDNVNIIALKSCLAAGTPIVFGFMVYESFESESVARTGVMHMPAANDRPMGGHAVICVGYDDAKQMFIVRNSWGPAWGDKGYFYMPYAYATNRNLASDFWAIQTISSSPK